MCWLRARLVWISLTNNIYMVILTFYPQHNHSFIPLMSEAKFYNLHQ